MNGNESWNGYTVDALMDQYDWLLIKVYDPDNKPQNRQDYWQAKRVWDTYALWLWVAVRGCNDHDKEERYAHGKSLPLLFFPMPLSFLFVCCYMCAETIMPPPSAAKQLRELAEDFIAAFNVQAGPGHATVYMHWMLCHVEKFVREYGSLMKFCCQGMEALHQVLRTLSRKFSNRSTLHTCGTALRRHNVQQALAATTVTSNSAGMVHGAVSKSEAVVVNPGHLSKAKLEAKVTRGEKLTHMLQEWVPHSERDCCDAA